jgi:beta-mannosidase
MKVSNWMLADMLTYLGSNSITVSFTSAITYSAKKFSEYPYFVNDGSDDPDDIQHGERHRNFIRKEQCSFSWDWVCILNISAS